MKYVVSYKSPKLDPRFEEIGEGVEIPLCYNFVANYLRNGGLRGSRGAVALFEIGAHLVFNYCNGGRRGGANWLNAVIKSVYDVLKSLICIHLHGTWTKS